MGTLEISVFAFRLAALYLFIQTVQLVSYFPTILALSDGQLRRTSWMEFALMICLQALLGIALWFASPVLARRFLGGPKSEPVPRASAIAGLGLKLTGIWLIDESLISARKLPFYFHYSSVSGSSAEVWSAMAITGTETVMGLGLLFGGARLGARLFRNSDSGGSIAREIQAVAFSILGLTIAVQALPDVFSGWGRALNLGDLAPWYEVVPAFVRLVIGLALFVGGGAVSRAWHWMQTAGLNRSRGSSDSPRH